MRLLPAMILLLLCLSGFSQENGSSAYRYKNLTVDSVKSLVQKHKMVLINFSADWCVICKRQKPYLDEIAALKKNSVPLIELDMDDNPLIAEYFEVDGLPVNILYKNGVMVWNRMGLQTSSQLLDVINAYE